MAREDRYDLNKASLLRMFGIQAMGGRSFKFNGQFASAEQIADIVAESAWNPAAGRFQATHTVGGKRPFVAESVVLQVLDLLEKGVPYERWKVDYKRRERKRPATRGRGQFISIELFDDFWGALATVQSPEERFGVFMRQRALISNVVSDAFKEYFAGLVPLLREVVKGIVKEQIYDTEADVIKYFQGGKPRMSASESRELSDHPWPEYKPSFALLNAYLDGIQWDGNTITVGVNTAAAPYWLWVERGHRVFFPQKKGEDVFIMESGTFVVGRPVLALIQQAVDNFMVAAAQEFTNSVASEIPGAIAEWVVQDSRTQRDAYVPLVKNAPSYGYGRRFEKYVGLI